MSKEFSSVMVGLPASGKSTFLAALWHVVQSGEVEYSLKLDRFDGNEDYLNEIRRRWLEGETLIRTFRGEERPVTLHLVATGEAAGLQLEIPDVGGEVFLDAIVERSWSQLVDEFVSSADGILLFVHSTKFTHPSRTEEVDTRAAEERAGGGGSPVASAGPGSSEPDEGIVVVDPSATTHTADAGGGAAGDVANEGQASPAHLLWDAHLIDKRATQVAVVEILQLTLESLASRERRRVAVVLSAWDCAIEIDPNAIPSKWLEERFPLLHQFLLANSDWCEYRIYGISAQGGSLPKARDELVGLAQPSQRLIVASAKDDSEHDITTPLRWLSVSGGDAP